MAAISRLKAKILSILLSLCEAESISYLDEVASLARSLDLAKSVALEVLLVSSIKKELGYSGSRQGQRAWRHISQRLKVDGIMEQFDGRVNGKIEPCLRLLDPMTTGSGNKDKKLNSGKLCQVIDQLVELPIEHQIFDMIDGAGSCGITLKEYWQEHGCS